MQKQITNFDIRTNAWPKGARLFFRSKSLKVHETTGEPIKNKKGEFIVLSHIYRVPGGRGIRGKSAIRHAKRLKVAAMKESGHFRGDNRPFEIVSQ